MKKLLFFLASFVLFSQTILPNFLYATDAPGEPDNAPVQENSIDNADTNDTDAEADNSTKDNADQTDTPADESPAPTDPTSDEPQNPDNEAENADEDDEEDAFVEIILDEGEEVVPYIPSENTENAESNVMSTKKARFLEPNLNENVDIYIDSLNTQSLTIFSTSPSFICPSSPSLSDIKTALLDYVNGQLTYLKDEKNQDLLKIMNDFTTAKGILNNFMAGNTLNDSDVATLDTLLTALKNVNFYVLADTVDTVAGELTGSITTCF
jgi:hypothetical protein